jgi:hypothetical protein
LIKALFSDKLTKDATVKTLRRKRQEELALCRLESGNAVAGMPVEVDLCKINSDMRKIDSLT